MFKIHNSLVLILPGAGCRLMIDGDLIREAAADNYGKLLFTFTIERRREVDFLILRY